MTPSEIIRARKQAGLTQVQAAALVYVTRNAWQKWEAGFCKMPQAAWELFLIKIGGVTDSGT